MDFSLRRDGILQSTVPFLFSIAIVAVPVAIAVVYTGRSLTWVVTNLGPGLGGLVSVALLVYYANLFRQSLEQTDAMRAGYAPNIDSRVRPVSEPKNYHEENGFMLSLVNRGEGVAKEIVVEIDIIMAKGEFRYRATTDTSLRPGRKLVARRPSQATTLVSNLRGFFISPTYYLGYYSETSRPYSSGSLNDVLINNTGSVSQLVIRLSYTDILGEEYGPELVCKEGPLPDEIDSTEELFDYIEHHSMPVKSSIADDIPVYDLYEVDRTRLDQFRDRLRQGHPIPVFEDSISAEVQDVEE